MDSKNKKLFLKYYDPKKYQVLFFSTKAPFPLSMFEHTFIITNKKGVLHRWEVWGLKHLTKHHNSTVYEDLFIHPWDGNITNFFTKIRIRKRDESTNTFLGFVEANTAKKMISVIYDSKKNYPFPKFYFPLPGPNCNSYTQWILNQFPEVSITLPKRALGRNFFRK